MEYLKWLGLDDEILSEFQAQSYSHVRAFEKRNPELVAEKAKYEKDDPRNPDFLWEKM